MESLQNELKALKDLEATGSLDEIQKARLVELTSQVEKLSGEDKTKKDLETALAQKEHFRTKAEKSETERLALEKKLGEAGKGNSKSSLDVEDYIDISASLEGLDQREKEYLASQSKLTGKSLSEIRKDENFAFWQSAYRQKVEKEKLSLTPSNRTGEADKPSTFEEQLAAATTIAEKEKLLAGANLYKAPHSRADRVYIGKER